ncbi:energy transducer TonB [Sphingobium cloacae]|uniref:TonB-like protein n=1 Tax=Sphingobium cloacae TaxID=120107 RepID=A0A1E1F6N7_9SPHN|nr:energy transducer TonB [Sphingobium cloacae]BAV66186.1 TonB-like protein [Sphingobium cloacae]
MLSVAEDRIDEMVEGSTAQPPSALRRAALVLPGTPANVRNDASRFGQGRRLNLPAITAIILVHAALLYALVQVRQHVIEAREAKLTVINLTPPPPPPPAESPPPPPSRPEIVAPPPLVQVPAPPVPLVATTPDPVPVPIPMPVMSPPGPPAPPAPPSIVQAGDLGTQMVAGKPPRYPVESRRKHEQGTVVLSLTLGADGSVESIAIAQSSGFKRLDDAARDAVRGWRWKPTIRDGRPTRVRGVVEIPFVLRTGAA